MEGFLSARCDSPVSILEKDVPVKGATSASLENAHTLRAWVASPREMSHQASSRLERGCRVRTMAFGVIS